MTGCLQFFSRQKMKINKQGIKKASNKQQNYVELEQSEC